MEIYEIKNEYADSITFGRYYTLVHGKHEDTYGAVGANNIRDNVIESYNAIQSNLYKTNRNSLLVGKVQSGKTANLELFTAFAFDNGYNFLVIYGGYDNSLLNQTTTRFRRIFDSPEEVSYEDNSPAIFSTDDKKNSILNIDDAIIQNLFECHKPIIFISMKRPVAMRKINDLLASIDKKTIKPFIIDDEGDQASLNTAKNKKQDASKTYEVITRMKDLLSNPMYLSVTATPHANIFLDKWSKLRPETIRLIQPSTGYTGAEIYHLDDKNNIVEIDKIDAFVDGSESLPKSLRDAILCFIVASAIKQTRENTRLVSDMIIHSDKETERHKTTFSSIEAYIKSIQDAFKNKNDSDLYLKEFEKMYNNYFVDVPESFSDLDIEKVVLNTHVILKNSKGKDTQSNENLRPYKIYIGGDLLQRGLTFKNLLITYFTRWAKNGNMDTTLQRARWFGYRSKYIDLCKIFTTSEIAQEFSGLAEIDEDLWEQFEDIENGKISINDIIISADKSSLRPTAPNKAKFKKISFRKKWIKQKCIIRNKKIIKDNDTIIDNIFNTYDLKPTTKGSRNNSTTGYYAEIKSEDLQDIINSIKSVFENEPFQKDAVLELLDSQEVIIIKMLPEERQRSLYFNTNKIKALQQGADSKDKNKIKYEGDSFVIVNPDKINIQIFSIIPRNNENIEEELKQYMFAIYVPKEKVYFTKDEQFVE
ncbi:MAG: Z1 domain-containing protein [Treponema sp.]|nr:Z1 domain-containing protein [Treponema sp.]